MPSQAVQYFKNFMARGIKELIPQGEEFFPPLHEKSIPTFKKVKFHRAMDNSIPE
jgi:hypothetical protein